MAPRGGDDLPKRALGGLRVLDFTWGGAGPLLTKTLGDFGADVIKVESKKYLDFPRALPPYAGKQPGVNRSAYFTNRNSSKRSIIIDLKAPEGLKVARELAVRADVMVDNFRGGVLFELGLGYRSLVSMNPGLICLSMPMTPTSGPSAGYRGVGRTIAGLTGIHALTGYTDGQVTGPGTHFPDHAANPGHGLVAILAALYKRGKTGRGAYIELAQVHSTLQLLGPSIIGAASSGEDPRPMGNEVPAALFSGALQATDGWFVLTIRSEADLLEMEKLVVSTEGDALELAQRAGEQGWWLDSKSQKRLAQWARSSAKEECVASLQKCGIPAALVEDAKSLVNDHPELWSVGHLVSLDHPEMGQVVYNAPPIHRADNREPRLSRAPLLGEHTKEVLEDWLAIKEEEFGQLVSSGAIG